MRPVNYAPCVHESLEMDLRLGLHDDVLLLITIMGWAAMLDAVSCRHQTI